RVDGPLVVKIAVLDRDGSVAEIPGHLVEGNDRSPLLVALFQESDAVPSVDPGGLGQALRAQVIEAGQLACVRIEQGSGSHQDGQQPDRGEEKDSAQPAMAARPPLSPAPEGSLTHGATGKRRHWPEGYPTDAQFAFPRSRGRVRVGACSRSV